MREGPRLDTNMSSAIKPTPTQMETSATLNVGQWSVIPQPCTTLPMPWFMVSIQLARKSMKSITLLRMMRSDRLPSAPPKTKGRPHFNARWPEPSRPYSETMNAIASALTARKNGRRIISLAFWSKPQAPPRL